MSVEDNKQLVRRYYDQVVNTGNVDNIANFVSPEYVEVHNNQRHEIGLKGAVDHVLGVRKTYPDLHLAVERQIGEGDWVATQIVVRGTHQGWWMGIKPTGKVLEFSGVNLDRVIGGRIVEHGGAVNMLEPLLQAGAINVVGT